MTVGDNELIFAKVIEDAIIPSKREEDGCMDLYSCFDEEFIVIQPHTNKLINTGIAFLNIPGIKLSNLMLSMLP